MKYPGESPVSRFAGSGDRDSQAGGNRGHEPYADALPLSTGMGAAEPPRATVTLCYEVPLLVTSWKK